MSLSLEKKLPIILLIALLLLAAIGFFAYQSTRSLQEAVRWQKQTQKVLLKLDEALIATTDVESSTRGFVVTGSEVFLEHYKNGKPRARKALEELEVLTADNETQRENQKLLAKYISDKIGINEQYTELRRAEGLLNAVNELSKGEGERIMAQVRDLVQKMKVEEERLLKFREENLEQTLNTNFWLILISSLAGIGALGLANFVVFQETKRRRLAELDLVEANQELEKRVEERTVELEKVNQELMARAEENEKLLKNEKSARREAEIATRQRDEFMATVSHELRTPLNAILGWAKIMQSPKTGEANRDKGIQTILKNAETQNRLIEDLMDVSRVISGKLTLEIEKVNAVELVTSSVEAIKPTADAKSIAVDLTIEGNARDQSVEGDPHRLRQIIGNLLTNAVKFTPENGKIDVGLLAQDGFLEITVKDNGAGISEDFLPFVFERFRQDRATIEKSGGLGLGLAIVRQLTELHGGTVSVESEGLNKGALFKVRFPAISQNSQLEAA